MLSNFATPAQHEKIPNGISNKAQINIQSTFLVYPSLSSLVASLAYSASYRVVTLRSSFSHVSDQLMVGRVQKFIISFYFASKSVIYLLTDGCVLSTSITPELSYTAYSDT